MEKIQLGKADFVVAGGSDDLDVAGMIGFDSECDGSNSGCSIVAEPREFSAQMTFVGVVFSTRSGNLLLTREHRPQAGTSGSRSPCLCRQLQ